ncbi:MAG: hypothetical protein A2508_02945 [Candidatus Lambdaproteobacteria bacterium RIFOXYD12_FULL_49_8]|uniref:C4-type zinc ribbon domain-containing protein n=1 Tax=Candidatus Lambdaproteobacteria bacterium RIFOXYD2_FULL_50_16 TaxID=1817772 RepID=A0A1F6GDK0_9PROT|nr:MAG: hypothetical protein A2527_04605 [Candidatus Lambdaproteobacteria bacterium RIFOXYD2_FULL_50_16]OGG98126.1 MAG: hypothetical protein A2508_02945 [Candidatus Lambdaproteobacteria bacterium RIFOXYD12_FULL_49_8]
MQESSLAILQIADQDRQILHSQQKLSQIPDKRAKVRANLDKVDQRLKKVSQDRSLLKLQVKLRERLIEVENKKIEESNRRMMEVSNQKEYMAVQKEIDLATRTIRKVEDQILDLEERVEPFDVELAEVEEIRTQEAARFEEQDKELAAEENKLSQTILAAKKEIETLTSKVGAELLAKYQKLVARNLTPAAVAIDDAFCLGCAISIRAQIFNEIIRAGQGECPNCRRLLFYRPKGEPASTAG